MILLEYEAKHLLRSATIAVPQSELLSPGDIPTFFPAVLKSQVPVGGRGKLGGIKIANTEKEARDLLPTLWNTSIKGHQPAHILAETFLAIHKELYLSLRVDRERQRVTLLVHPGGGVDIESHSPDSFLSLPLTHETLTYSGEQVAEYLDTPHLAFILQDTIERLYRCFNNNDAILLEINPLVITHSGSLVAGDCKMTLDDAAAFRHPEWNFSQTEQDTNFVTLDANGSVATVANGAGLAMATVDAVADAGLVPTNFLDIGGGSSPETVYRSLKTLHESFSVSAIIINIFAGITRCDEVATAIIEASSKLPDLPPLCIRLSGNNYDQAAALLSDASIPLLPTLEDCIAAAERIVQEARHG